jgi:RNA polymerase sigma factor (sigma-70 family)
MPDHDATLLRRFTRERAEAAFAELVRRHVNAVYSTARRRVGGDSHLAEDVTQQVFAALARRAASLVTHPALGAWLHTATRHAAAHVVRTERRRKAREQTAAAMPDSPADPTANLDWSRLAPVIDRAIDHLAEPDRTAVHLRFIENRSFADVGAALRVSEDAARMRVERALAKLRTALARRGIDSTAAALGLILADHAVVAAPAGLAAQAASHALAANAAASASSAAGFFHAMTAAKLTVATVGAVLLLSAIGTATYELHRWHAAGLALEADRRELAALGEQLHTVNSQAAATEKEAAALRQKIRERRTARSQAAAKSVSNSSIVRTAPDPAVAAGRALMDHHPEVREAFIDWLNAQINFQWSGFYESVGLTRDQIATFQSLLRANRSMAYSEPRYLRLTSDPLPIAEQQSRLRELLGTDGYRKYQDYVQSLPTREFVAQLAGALAFTPTPLTAAEFDQFSAKIAGAVKIGPTGPQYDWETISAGAEGVLSPEQRAAVDSLRAQAAFDQEFSRVLSAPGAANNSNAAGGSTP